jgi:hypothetical protein
LKQLRVQELHNCPSPLWTIAYFFSSSPSLVDTFPFFFQSFVIGSCEKKNCVFLGLVGVLLYYVSIHVERERAILEQLPRAPPCLLESHSQVNCYSFPYFKSEVAWIVLTTFEIWWCT